MYLRNLLTLWAARSISFQVLCDAIKTRSIVVEGKDRAYVVDSTFEPTQTFLKKRNRHGIPRCRSLRGDGLLATLHLASDEK